MYENEKGLWLWKFAVVSFPYAERLLVPILLEILCGRNQTSNQGSGEKG